MMRYIFIPNGICNQINKLIISLPHLRRRNKHDKK
jgi:hypothetical protein